MVAFHRGYQSIICVDLKMRVEPYTHPSRKEDHSDSLHAVVDTTFHNSDEARGQYESL